MNSATYKKAPTSSTSANHGETFLWSNNQKKDLIFQAWLWLFSSNLNMKSAQKRYHFDRVTTKVWEKFYSCFSHSHRCGEIIDCLCFLVDTTLWVVLCAWIDSCFHFVLLWYDCAPPALWLIQRKSVCARYPYSKVTRNSAYVEPNFEPEPSKWRKESWIGCVCVALRLISNIYMFRCWERVKARGMDGTQNTYQ